MFVIQGLADEFSFSCLVGNDSGWNTAGDAVLFRGNVLQVIELDDVV